MLFLSLHSSASRAAAMALCAALMLGGCAGGRDHFPSLALRPAERAFGTAQPVNPAPTPDADAPLPASASVIERIAALKAQANSAHNQFESRRGAAVRLAGGARGATPGSEAWSVAQVALAQLDSARSQGMIAMADLDRMLVVAAQAAQEGSGSGSDSDLTLVQAAQADVSALVSDEDAVIAGLRAQVAG